MTARLGTFFAATARRASRQISERLAREDIGKSAPDRVRRDAFLYMDGDDPNFAQCSSCALFRPADETCVTVTGHIVAAGSCGLYARGAPDDDQPRRADVSQAAAGYVVRAVRCENCRFFDADGALCSLYVDLDERFPDVFNLDPAVVPRGCCNAQMPLNITAVEKSADHGLHLHVEPQNATPIYAFPVADAVTVANVMHIAIELMQPRLETVRRRVALDDLIAGPQRVVDRARVAKHEAEMRATGEVEAKRPPLVLLWDGDYFILGGHHGLTAARNLGVKEVEVDVLVAPGD